MKENDFLVVSIILPVFNEEKNVRQTIENICNQSFQDFELIIVNDGSVDNSQEIIDSMQDKRIRRVLNKKNKGLTKTLNVGLGLAKGRFVAIANCGDVWNKDKLRKQVREMSCNLGLVVVGTTGQYSGKKTARASNNAEMAMYFGDPFIHSSVLIRNIEDLHYNEEFVVTQDYELWQKLMKKGKMIVLKDCLVDLREQKPHPFENTIKVLRRFYPKESGRMIKIITMEEKPTVKEYLELILVFSKKAMELKSFEFVKLAVFRLIVILKIMKKGEC